MLISSPGQRGELHSYASAFIFIYIFTMMGWEWLMLLQVLLRLSSFRTDCVDLPGATKDNEYS